MRYYYTVFIILSVSDVHCLAGSLPVKQAHLVHRDLVKGHKCLVLATDLHLLYLATPLDLGSTLQPDWMVFFEVVSVSVKISVC